MLFQDLNQKHGTVYWILSTDGQELEIGSGRRIYLYGRDEYRRIDRTQNVSWSAWAYLERPKSYQDRRHRHRIGGNRLWVVNERTQDVSKSAATS